METAWQCCSKFDYRAIQISLLNLSNASEVCNWPGGANGRRTRQRFTLFPSLVSSELNERPASGFPFRTSTNLHACVCYSSALTPVQCVCVCVCVCATVGHNVFRIPEFSKGSPWSILSPPFENHLRTFSISLRAGHFIREYFKPDLNWKSSNGNFIFLLQKKFKKKFVRIFFFFLWLDWGRRGISIETFMSPDDWWPS